MAFIRGFLRTAWSFVLFAVTVWVVGCFVNFVTKLPILGALLAALVVTVLTFGGEVFLAVMAEGCDDVAERYNSAPASFAIGMIIWSLLIGFGAWGMNVIGTPVRFDWRLVAFVFIVWRILRWHHHAYFGNEEKGIKSTDKSPTRRYHDFMSKGLWLYLSITTWMPFILIGAGMIAVDQMGSTGIVIYIIEVILLVVQLIIHIVSRKQIPDLAEMYPANWRKLNCNAAGYSRNRRRRRRRR